MQRLQRQRAQVVRKLSIFSLVFVVLTVLGLIALYHLRIKAAEWGSSRTRPSSVPSRFLSALFTSTFPVSFVAQGNVNEGPDGPPFIAGHGPLARRSLGADSFSGDGTATTGFVVAEVPNCYHYRRAVNVVLFVSLSVLLVLQTVLCLVYRRTKHLFAAAVLFGLTLEVAGYGARVYMSYLPSNFGRVRLT